jgi:hypothetical protein
MYQQMTAIINNDILNLIETPKLKKKLVPIVKLILRNYRPKNYMTILIVIIHYLISFLYSNFFIY